MTESLLQFHFLRPLWLLALLPLALLLVSRLWKRRPDSAWQAFIAPELLPRLLQGQDGKRLPVVPLLVLGWLLSVLALSGPTWQRLPQPLYQLGAARVILWDMSLSMYAEDVPPNRLERSRFKLYDLLARSTEVDTGLVVYAGEAFAISPLTSDRANLNSQLPALSPQIMPVTGSHPVAAVRTGIALLESGGYLQGDLLLVTDEITPSEVTSIQFLLQGYNYRLHILGVGTPAGAPVRLPDQTLLRDSNGNIVSPALEEAALVKLAQATGGIYRRLSADEGDIDALAAAMDSQGQGEQAGQPTYVRWHDAGYWLILPLLPLMLLVFRRGVLPALVLMTGLQPPPALAGTWSDLWARPDQQGYQAFSAEDYDQASTLFESPAWRGSSHYRNGDYEQALEAFSQGDDAHSWYNRGNALAQLGRFDTAIAAYDEALARQPDFTAAEHNRRLLQRLSQAQQSQDGEGGETSQQQGQSSSESQQSAGTSAEQGQEQGQAGEPSAQQDAAGFQAADNEANQEDGAPQGTQQQSTGGNDGDSQGAALADATTPLDEARQRQLERWLEQVPDDPARLLRNKMRLEYERRRQQGTLNQEKQVW